MRPNKLRSEAKAEPSIPGGALPLALAGIVSRVIGAAHRILLYALLRGEGMGLLQMALPVYFMALVPSTAGIATATTRLVAEREAECNSLGAEFVFIVSAWILGVLGFVLSVLLFATSQSIGLLLTKDVRSALVIRAVAPGLFFDALSVAFRGLFQGRQSMRVPAMSSVVEQVVTTLFAFPLVLLLLPMGAEVAAAGAGFATVIGSAAAFAYLICAYRAQRRRLRKRHLRSQQSQISLGVQVFRNLAGIAIPVTAASLVLTATRFAGFAVIPARLRSTGLSVSEVTALYGRLAGGAVSLVMLPTVITSALGLSLIPAVTEAQIRRDMPRVRSLVATSVRLSLMIMLPVVVGFGVLAREITSVLFRDPQITDVLLVMAASPLFASLQQITSSALQGLGRFNLVMRIFMLEAVVDLCVTYLLTGIPGIGIMGAALGSLISLVIATACGVHALSLNTGGILVGERLAVLRAVFAAVAMGFALRYGYDRLLALTGNEPTSLACTIAVGLLVYMVGAASINRAKVRRG